MSLELVFAAMRVLRSSLRGEFLMDMPWLPSVIDVSREEWRLGWSL